MATQIEAVPIILGGGDVAVVTETGSGKTGSPRFLIAQIVLKKATELESKLDGSLLSDACSLEVVLSKMHRRLTVTVDSAGLVAQFHHAVILDGISPKRVVVFKKWESTLLPVCVTRGIDVLVGAHEFPP